jgi:hypothetical protein
MRASAYEHLIPEKRFTDQTQANAPQSISAVKALAIASSQGQKIFTITPDNQGILLPQINVAPDVITEMQNALSAGKEVTVHQLPITLSGWTGTGYIITDPATGFDLVLRRIPRGQPDARETRIPSYRRRGAGRHGSCGNLFAHHPSRILQSQDLAARHPSRR